MTYICGHIYFYEYTGATVAWSVHDSQLAKTWRIKSLWKTAWISNGAISVDNVSNNHAFSFSVSNRPSKRWSWRKISIEEQATCHELWIWWCVNSSRCHCQSRGGIASAIPKHNLEWLEHVETRDSVKWQWCSTSVTHVNHPYSGSCSSERYLDSSLIPFKGWFGCTFICTGGLSLHWISITKGDLGVHLFVPVVTVWNKRHP